MFRQEIDWGLTTVKKGEVVTNLDLALKGYTPYIIKDGKIVQLNLHHSNQNALGPLFEISETTHNKYDRSNALHPYKTNKKNGGSGLNPYDPVNRTIFNKDRDNYWKNRANEVLNKTNQENIKGNKK